MTTEEYRNAIEIVIYLSGCAVNGLTPDAEMLKDIDLEQLFKAAESHSLTSIVGYSLEKAGIIDPDFQNARAKTIRRLTVMEVHKNFLFKRMDQEKIWYMPLKGTVIKDLYPDTGLRQMSDYDILFDKEYANKVKEILLGLGFTCESFEISKDDVYFKQPVVNFEMHRSLFDELSSMYDYYHDIKTRLIKDDGDNCGYHFSSNDMYIYITAHEYKHYSVGGTGLRSLLDKYVILQKLGDQLDNSYIHSECKKLGISEYEQSSRNLALHLFGNGKLSVKEMEMLEYIIFSGTYGTIDNSMKILVGRFGTGKKAKFRYYFHRVFLPMKYVNVLHPTVYRHKILLPFLPFYRIIRAFTVNRKETTKKINTIKKLR